MDAALNKFGLMHQQKEMDSPHNKLGIMHEIQECFAFRISPKQCEFKFFLIYLESYMFVNSKESVSFKDEKSVSFKDEKSVSFKDEKKKVPYGS